MRFGPELDFERWSAFEWSDECLDMALPAQLQRVARSAELLYVCTKQHISRINVNTTIKAALIIAAAIVVAAALFIYFVPPQTCAIGVKLSPGNSNASYAACIH
jgi:hypothetical protein